MTRFCTISFNDTHLVRQAVLWPDKPLKHIMIDADEDALHVGAYEGDSLVGVGSFFLSTPNAQLRKLAILPAYQRVGIGTQLLFFGGRILKQQGIELLWCDARENSKAFYEKMGFRVDGEVFVKSGVSYLKAERSLLDL